jgi:inosose dehydratase
LGKRNLKVCASFVLGDLEEPSAWPELEKQVEGTGELLAALGAKYLVLIDGLYTDLHTGAPTGPSRLDPEAWKRLIDTTNKIADIARDRFGLTLAYHPHAETHVEYEDQVEALLEQTDPARVSLCLDTGSFAHREGDPVSFVRRHHRRIPYLHFKNVDGEVLKRVDAEKISFVRAVGMGIYCEPSRGVVDFPALKEVLSEVGYEGWAIVEQDLYPTPFDRPLPIAKQTRAYLREIGMG